MSVVEVGQYFVTSRNVRDDKVWVVELGQIQHGQNIFQLVPGEHDGGCEVRPGE